MRVIRVVLIGFLALGGIWAEEVSGQWAAEVQGRLGGSTEISMDLKADDALLTGTLRTPRGEAAISAGTIDGDNISFSVLTDLNGYQITQHFRGTLEGDLIHFSLTVEDGHANASPTRDFEAKRISKPCIDVSPSKEPEAA